MSANRNQAEIARLERRRAKLWKELSSTRKRLETVRERASQSVQQSRTGGKHR